MWIPSLPVTVISAAAASAGLLCLFKDFYGGGPYDPAARADNKTVIITGANTGIGREAAWEFANRGAKVFMACRNMELCEAERREIVLQTNNKFVYCRPCDLASTQSIRKFVKTFKSEEPCLNILVNNAAVMEPKEKITADGFETHLGVNHLGHFLLTNLLLDTLKTSSPSRVIIVTDSAHRRGAIHRDDLNMTTSKETAAKYAQSKLANVLFARELAVRLLDSNISVAVVDPGLTDSDLTRNLAMSKSITRYFVYPIFWPIMKTPRTAAQVILHAALDSRVDKCCGDYFKDMKKTEPSVEAQDYDVARWLWKVSEKWTKLDEHRQALNANAA